VIKGEIQLKGLDKKIKVGDWCTRNFSKSFF